MRTQLLQEKIQKSSLLNCMHFEIQLFYRREKIGFLNSSIMPTVY